MTQRPVALITGAARGIGRTIALTFAHNNYDIAMLDISFDSYKDFPDDQNKDVRDELTARGCTVESAEASTTDTSAMTDLVSRAVERWGRIDAVICNAGGGSGPLEGNRASDIDLAALTDVLQRNLYGTITTVTAALPALTASPHPSIVTMSSLNGVEPTDNGRYAHYGIAKAAVAHYTRYLARDLSDRGIRANCSARCHRDGAFAPADGRKSGSQCSIGAVAGIIRNCKGRCGIGALPCLANFTLRQRSGHQN